MGKSPDEDSDCELTRLVLQDPLHDPWRKLTHRELHDDHSDRKHKRCQADHRCGYRAQDLHGGVRATADPMRDELVVERPINRDRAEREGNARQPHRRVE